MNRLLAPLQVDSSISEHDIRAPKLLVRIGYEGRWSRPIRALVDTGSSVTLINPEAAQKLGWVQPADEQPVELQGLGSKQPALAWKATMDVAFLKSAAQEPTLGLLLRRTTVFISQLVEQGAMLIGQHESLERLRFVQRNQPPFWDFELALPDEDESQAR